MPREARLAAKAFAALVTLVVLLAGVHYHVATKYVRLKECLAATLPRAHLLTLPMRILDIKTSIVIRQQCLKKHAYQIEGVGGTSAVA